LPAEKVSSPIFIVLFGIPRVAEALAEALPQKERNPDYGFCEYFSQILYKTYIGTSPILANKNHKPFKLCCLCYIVSPLGMSLPYAFISLPALSFELSATPAFSLLPMRLGYFYLTKITNLKKWSIYMILLVLWVCRIQKNFLSPISYFLKPKA
jgi:hypothetical protein